MQTYKNNIKLSERTPAFLEEAISNGNTRLQGFDNEPFFYSGADDLSGFTDLSKFEIFTGKILFNFLSSTVAYNNAQLLGINETNELVVSNVYGVLGNLKEVKGRFLAVGSSLNPFQFIGTRQYCEGVLDGVFPSTIAVNFIAAYINFHKQATAGYWVGDSIRLLNGVKRTTIIYYLLVGAGGTLATDYIISYTGTYTSIVVTNSIVGRYYVVRMALINPSSDVNVTIVAI